MSGVWWWTREDVSRHYPLAVTALPLCTRGCWNGFGGFDQTRPFSSLNYFTAAELSGHSGIISGSATDVSEGQPFKIPSACRQSWRSCPHLELKYFCCQKQKPVKKSFVICWIIFFRSYTQNCKKKKRCKSWLPWWHWTPHWRCSCRPPPLRHRSAREQQQDL